MKKLWIPVLLGLIAGCSSQDIAHYSPYDLDRDGVMDMRCPGMTYDTGRGSLYGWRSKASDECEAQAPQSQAGS